MFRCNKMFDISFSSQFLKRCLRLFMKKIAMGDTFALSENLFLHTISNFKYRANLTDFSLQRQFLYN